MGSGTEREFFVDNLLVRIHFIIVMIGWTGLAPWEFAFPFPGSLTITFLVRKVECCTDGTTHLLLCARGKGTQGRHRSTA